MSKGVKGSGRYGMTQEDIAITRTRMMPIHFRLIPYFTPWVVGLLTLPIGAALHRWASSALWMPVLTACAGVLVWATHKLWDRRHVYTQRLVTAYAGALCLWLIIAAAVGVVAVLKPWAVAWVMTSALWNIRLGSISVTNKHDKIAGEPETAWEVIRGLKGIKTKFAKLTRTEAGQDKAVIRVQVPGGQVTPSDVQAAREHIAGRFAMASEDVTIKRVSGRDDQADVEIMKDNPTKHVIAWPGLRDAGKSIIDAPLNIGVRMSGAPFGFWIVGDDEQSRPLPHTLVSGMNGSGKTEAMIIADLEIRARLDAVPVVGNPRKFMIDFADVADMYPIAAADEQQVRQLINNLPEAGDYRAWLLGKLGYKQWVPECYTKHGIPLIFIRIEEAASVLAKNEPFKRATETFRALGMPIAASMQVAVFRNIDREARSQFGNSLAFGVSDMQDARFVLTDKTLAAGADPTQWKNNQPGRLYGEVVGIDEDLWPEPVRAWKASRAQKRAAIEATRAHWAVIDDGTSMRLGHGIERPDTVISSMLPTVIDLGHSRTEAVSTGPGKMDMIKSDEATVPNLSVISGGQTDGRTPTEDAREMIAGHIDDLERDRADKIITAKDFDHLVGMIGRASSWIYWELDRQAKRGRLERLVDQPGRVYRIIPRDHQATDDLRR